MIGNDIVDLHTAAVESNWRRRGFLGKLFNTEEQVKILSSSSPELFVWLLWSMKEAAYKAHQRQYNLDRSYRPQNYSCKIFYSEDNSAKGKVECGEDIFTTQSTISSSYIHTTASSSEGKEIISKVFSSSENMKSTFISQFAGIKNCCESEITIKKDSQSIPQLSFKGLLFDSAFSFSHHGKYSAYALSLMNY